MVRRTSSLWAARAPFKAVGNAAVRASAQDGRAASFSTLPGSRGDRARTDRRGCPRSGDLGLRRPWTTPRCESGGRGRVVTMAPWPMASAGSLVRRRNGPVSSRRCASCSRRSQSAPAWFGSPVTACHSTTRASYRTTGQFSLLTFNGRRSERAIRRRAVPRGPRGLQLS